MLNGRGIVHRDIKPDNVLLSGRHAFVTDFGIAKAVSEATGRNQITTAGIALGTPTYMAPEQAVADPNIDYRADIYAVGVMAYEMLTGHTPFAGTSAQMVLAAHVTETPRPVTDHRQSVPPQVAEAVMRCLEKKPADRWQKTDELIACFESNATPSGGISPTGLSQPKAVGARPPIGRLVALGVGLIAVVSLFGFLFTRGGDAAVDLDPEAVAVLPFRTSGGETLSDLRIGMVDIMHAHLTGEGGLRAVDPRRLLVKWREYVADEEEDLPPSEALRLARELGAGRAIVGSVTEAAGRVTIAGDLYDTQTGDVIAAPSATGPPDSVASLVDQWVVELFARTAGARETQLQSLSTSIDAVRSYLAGIQLYRGGKYLEAVRTLERAVDADSTFALAVLALAKAARSAGNTNVGREYLGDALTHLMTISDRLSPRDQAYLNATAGRNWPRWTDGEVLLRDAERAIELAPDDPSAVTNLANLQAGRADFLGDSAGVDRAAALYDRALALDSSHLAAIQGRLGIAVLRSDTARVRSLRDQYITLDPDGDQAQYWRWRIARELNESETLDALRSELGTGGQLSLTWMGYAVVFEGAPLDDWIMAAERFDAGAVTALERLRSIEQRRKIALMQGRLEDGLQLSDSLVDQNFFDTFQRSSRIDMALLGPGWDSSAAEIVEFFEATVSEVIDTPEDIVELYQRFSAQCGLAMWKVLRADAEVAADLVRLDLMVDQGQRPLCPVLIRALLEDAEGTLTVERIAELKTELNNHAAASPGQTVALFTLARLKEKRGDLAGALALVQRRPRLIGVSVDMQQNIPAFLREEGRLAALAGDTAVAIRAYEKYLNLRTDPDPVLQPEVDQIRGALADLVGEGGRN